MTLTAVATDALLAELAARGLTITPKRARATTAAPRDTTDMSDRELMAYYKARSLQDDAAFHARVCRDSDLRARFAELADRAARKIANRTEYVLLVSEWRQRRQAEELASARQEAA